MKLQRASCQKKQNRTEGSRSAIDSSSVSGCLALRSTRADFIGRRDFMDLAMIGLGKMGLNMSTRLTHGGHHVVGYDPAEQAVKEAMTAGVEGAYSLEEAASKLKAPRIFWLMVTAG